MAHLDGDKTLLDEIIKLTAISALSTIHRQSGKGKALEISYFSSAHQTDGYNLGYLWDIFGYALFTPIYINVVTVSNYLLCVTSHRRHVLTFFFNFKMNIATVLKFPWLWYYLQVTTVMHNVSH